MRIKTALFYRWYIDNFDFFTADPTARSSGFGLVFFGAPLPYGKSAVYVESRNISRAGLLQSVGY